MPPDEYCINCRFRKVNKTCKENPRRATGDHDWCGAWKKKATK